MRAYNKNKLTKKEISLFLWLAKKKGNEKDLRQNDKETSTSKPNEFWQDFNTFYCFSDSDITN